MKKFVLAFGIPVLAVASLIGSGYATWYFNSDVVTNNNDIALELKEKRVVGAEFQHTGEISLVLDQPVKNDGMPTGREDVHFKGTFQESLVANDGVTNTFVNETSYKVTTKIIIPSVVAEYVNFTFNDQTSSAVSADSDGFITLTKGPTTYKAEKDTKKFDVFSISEVDVAYTAKEPKDSAAYDTMHDALTGQTIRISFAAEIVK